MKRLSQTHEDQEQFYIILTDLADTRYRDLLPIPAQAGSTRVLVTLVPADPKEAQVTYMQVG